MRQFTQCPPASINRRQPVLLAKMTRSRVQNTDENAFGTSKKKAFRQPSFEVPGVCALLREIEFRNRVLQKPTP